jgi:hypothetical protein
VSSSAEPETREYAIEPPPERDDKEFQAIAQLITAHPPAWLNQCLNFLCSSVWVSLVRGFEQPTRGELKRTLAEVSDATKVLYQALSRPIVLEFLAVGRGRPVTIPQFLFLQMMLADVHNWADAASNSPRLVTPDGKTKGGRGRAYAGNPLLSQTYCALVIAECWKRFRGAYPAPRNRKAAEAAETLWQFSTGQKSGYGGADPLEGWRSRFEKAQSPDAERRRTETCDSLRRWEAWSEESKVDGDGCNGNQSG